MTSGWVGSDRRSRLPADWSRTRLRILTRDGWVCQIKLDGCSRAATEVDHVTAGDDHREANLRAACSRCHAIKTAHDATAARRAIAARSRRPPEPHPGLLTPGG